MVSRVSVNPGSEREQWSKPTARIDWLAGTISERDCEGREAVHAWLEDPQRCSADAGFRDYNDWHRDRHGTKVARVVSSDRFGKGCVQRTYLVLKGSGLMHLRANNQADDAILLRFMEWRGLCKRIDLAVDVKHADVTPRALFDLYEKQHFVTRLQEPVLWQSPNGGETFYLMGKGQTFRCYNKTAERKRKGITLVDGITRLEMELRGKWAARAFGELAVLLNDRSSWSETFPKRAAEIILSKARPLDEKRPARNAIRAPTWSPLARALDDVGPVRLARQEELRALEERLAGKQSHFQNNLKAMALMRSILGEEAFNAAISKTELDADDQAFLAMLQAAGPRLRSTLVDSGVLPVSAEQPEASRAASN